MSTTRDDVLRALSFRNISAIYIFVVMFVIFSLWIPQKFLQVGVWRPLLDAGGAHRSLRLRRSSRSSPGRSTWRSAPRWGSRRSCRRGYGQGGTRSWQLPAVVLSGRLIGLVTGLVITRLRVEPIIATLGISSILLAGMAWVSGSQQILGLGDEYKLIATTQFGGVTIPVYVLLAVALLSWYVLERTPVGRCAYAAGYNLEAARLAGVHVERLRIWTLVAGGAIAALAGALLTSRINAGDPTVGPSFLLSALPRCSSGRPSFAGAGSTCGVRSWRCTCWRWESRACNWRARPLGQRSVLYGVALVLAVALAVGGHVATRPAIGRLVDRVLPRKR
ncbi:MAG: hypothetical protein R2717_08705 [Schumannella sp.]